MKRLVLIFLLLASPAFADIGIKLPDMPSPPAPPAPAPDAAQKLNASEYFIITSETQPCIVLSSPAGFVNITSEAGPLRIRGQFVGGGGKIETRNFTQKYLYIVEAAKTGSTEVLVVPTGAASAKDVLRRTLNVDAQDPIPPPGPVKPTLTLSITPDTIQPGGSTTLIWATTGATIVKLTPGLEALPLSGSRTLTPAQTTIYTITAGNASGDLTQKSAQVTVSAPPVPPAPPAPIPADGNRVLIVYESSELTKLPASQQDVLYSTTFRDWVKSKCVMVGGTPEFRVMDQNVSDTGTVGDIWKAALGRKRDSLPWIIISTGKTGFEGPLPKTIDETKALIGKYFGS